MTNQAADLQLARVPESPETLALLLDAHRTGDALEVLRRIVDRHPERMGAAFEAASPGRHRFADEGRGYPSVLRDIVATARQRLRELPREQAAEAAWHLLFFPPGVQGEPPVPWHDQLRAFAAEYAGTDAALLAELRLLDQDGEIHARIDALEAFARRHAGTAIGAQALYVAASHLGFNARDPRGADPTERLLRIAEIARELQSGAYPDCEWVRRAPGLVFGFFADKPQYARENVPRVIAVFREFLVKHFDVAAVNPLASGVGYHPEVLEPLLHDGPRPLGRVDPPDVPHGDRGHVHRRRPHERRGTDPHRLSRLYAAADEERWQVDPQRRHRALDRVGAPTLRSSDWCALQGSSLAYAPGALRPSTRTCLQIIVEPER